MTRMDHFKVGNDEEDYDGCAQLSPLSPNSSRSNSPQGSRKSLTHLLPA